MIKKIIFGILNFVVRFSIAALVVVGVYRVAMYSYHFGYMVFSDTPKEPAPGRDVIVTVENTEDIMALGRLLSSRGLAEDEKIFFCQERLSESHGKLEPGTYTFNTSMKPSQMMEMMSASHIDEEEEGAEGAENGEKKQEETAPTQDTMYDPMTGELIENADGAAEGTDNPQDGAEDGAEDGAGDASGEDTGTEQTGGDDNAESKPAAGEGEGGMKAGAGW
ncbi:MAG: hypothetical protein K5739_08410 [Lachnospiraceae bacterium]|nr:hypothetical protein [Lachnospiraceae bacterium]